MKKLIKALGGLAVIVGLAGGVNADTFQTHPQQKRFEEFYKNGRQEYPLGNYTSLKERVQIDGLCIHPVKRKVKYAVNIPRQVIEEKTDCNGNKYYVPGIIYEPHCIEKEETLGYAFHYNKKDACWYKGLKKAKEIGCTVASPAVAVGLRARDAGQAVCDDLKDAGRYLKDKCNPCRNYNKDIPQGAIKYRAPSKIYDRINPNNYQREVPSTGQPTFAPSEPQIPKIKIDVPEVPEKIRQPTLAPKKDSKTMINTPTINPKNSIYGGDPSRFTNTL